LNKYNSKDFLYPIIIWIRGLVAVMFIQHYNVLVLDWSISRNSFWIKT